MSEILSNLLFSLEVVLPLFIMMALGFFLKKKAFISDAFAVEANRLLYYVVMPAKLAYDLWLVDLSGGFPLDLGIIIIIGIIGTALVAIPLAKAIGLNRESAGTFAHAAYRGNYIFFGFPLLESITGHIHPMAQFVIIFTLVLYNIIAVMMLQWANGEVDVRYGIQSTVRQLLTNPFILGILIGVILNVTNLPAPTFVRTTLGFFSQLATPLALIAIGASFSFSKSQEYRLPGFAVSALKLVISPLIMVLAAALLGYRGETLVIMYVIFGVPTAISSYAMVESMAGDTDLAASSIFYTTVFSIITTTLFIFAFRQLGVL